MEKQQKYDWRKQEKEIYPARKKLSILRLPKQRFITISGIGNFNDEDFGQRVSALYALSYIIKMAPRKEIHFADAFDYGVYPLEEIWSLVDVEKGVKDKSNFAYKIMLKQPDFITAAVFKEALKIAEKKIDSPLIDELILEDLEEGLVAQLVHVGSFDKEQETFEKLTQLLKEQGYYRTEKEHKEIYLKDFNKTAPENMKTILRVNI